MTIPIETNLAIAGASVSNGHISSFCYLLIFFSNSVFLSVKSKDPDQNLIWVQTVCKGYQQMTKVGESVNISNRTERYIFNLMGNCDLLKF